MLDGGALRGVAYVASRVGSLDAPLALGLVEQTVAPFGLAIQRENDRTDATYDGLTGLLAPRAFRLALREELERARGRGGRVLSLWFVDTDRFKCVNDQRGHAAGDGVLQQMAELLRAGTVTGIDQVARNGGDEFCALVHDTQKTHAIERAQAFCEAVRRHDFGAGIRVTASVGVASCPLDADAANGLLELADAAMYHSKREGRDRVSFVLDGAFAVYR